MPSVNTFFSRNNLIIHFGFMLFITKVFLSFTIGFLSIRLLSVLYPLVTWITVSLIVDALIFSLKPAFLFNFTLTKPENIRYRVNTNEMKKCIWFTPMIRFIRTVLLSLFVVAFFSGYDWNTHLMISLAIGFLIIDPIIKKILDIKTPILFKKIPADEPILSPNIHRNNPGYIGSAAWNAFESTRPIKTDLNLP